MDTTVDATGRAVRPLPAVVLAAGQGRRFRSAGGTGPKVLADLGGRPILARVLDTAHRAGLDPVLVIVGPDLDGDPALTDVLLGRRSVRLVVNRRAAEGPGTSLSAGLDHLADDPTVPACVVLLGDQPGIAPAVVTDAVATWRRTGAPVRTRYLDGPGHPVVLPAELWSMLVGRTVEGAREVLDDLGAEEVIVEALAPRDVDVPDDLASR